MRGGLRRTRRLRMGRGERRPSHSDLHSLLVVLMVVAFPNFVYGDVVVDDDLILSRAASHSAAAAAAGALTPGHGRYGRGGGGGRVFARRVGCSVALVVFRREVLVVLRDSGAVLKVSRVRLRPMLLVLLVLISPVAVIAVAVIGGIRRYQCGAHHCSARRCSVFARRVSSGGGEQVVASAGTVLVGKGVREGFGFFRAPHLLPLHLLSASRLREQSTRSAMRSFPSTCCRCTPGR